MTTLLALILSINKDSNKHFTSTHYTDENIEKATQNPGNAAFNPIRTIKKQVGVLSPLVRFSNAYPSNENLSVL